jgi:DNA polymerase III epsilon subunit-like protein
MASWTTLTFVVVDVEGNGQHPPDLVELAAVSVTGGVIGEPVSWLVRPPQPIKYYATRIHGLSTKDVAGAPAFADVAGQVRQALDAADAMVAHNAHVDIDVLGRELPGWQAPEVFDTLKLSRRLLPGQGSYKLANLVELLKLADGLPAGLSPHRATYDALVTARLFARLATRPDGSPLSIGELHGPGHDPTPGEAHETTPLF